MQKRRFRFVTLFAVVAFGLSPLAAQPAGLVLVEVGGNFADGNHGTTGTPFALDALAGFEEAHGIPHINDGIYGNPNSWIGETAPAFAGISFPQSITVASLAFGRDNFGALVDRNAGMYTFQYTTVAAPDETTPDGDWQTIGELNYADGFPSDTPWLRHRYNIVDAGGNNVSVDATGIRLLVPAAGIGGGTAIDEIEVYSVSGEPPPPPTFDFELVEIGGMFDENNLAQGATPFGTPALVCCDAHEIDHINDGLYGNPNSYISEVNPGFIGVAFGEAVTTVASFAFGRDNDPGTATDRTGGLYTVQGTTSANPDADTPDEEWFDIGQLNYTADSPSSTPWRRHRYNLVSIAKGLNGFDSVDVTAIRLLIPPGAALDELELYATPGDTVVAPLCDVLETGGPIATPAQAADVLGEADGNLALSADAVPFGTPPFPAPAHMIEHLNDGLYGNPNSWLGNEAGATSGLVYAGIYFMDGPKLVQKIALGRDNTGALGDRTAGDHTVQITQDAFDFNDDAAVDAASWTTVCRTSAMTLREVYALGSEVRAVRVITALGNVIDELELLVEPPAKELVLVEVGGTLAEGNLALEEGATAFAIDSLACCPDVHNIPNLNDGLYGNGESWIGETGNPPFVGIALAGQRTVASFAFGRDNGGEEMEFVDRTQGRYVLQYTLAEAPNAETPDGDWVDIGEFTYDCAVPDATPWLRHRFNFPEVEATGLRLIVPAAGIGAGTAVDEFEIYSVPGIPNINPLVLPLRQPDLVGGPLTTPANPGTVPTVEAGNLARLPEAIPFATPPFPLPAHQTVNLNDGSYSNGFSWLGNEVGPVSGKVYAGIYFDDSLGLQKVAEIAFGRDNTVPAADRLHGLFEVQYTQDSFDPTDDGLTDAANWMSLFVTNLCDGPLRHLYSFPETAVRAVRIVCNLGNVIDEIELGLTIGTPPPPSCAIQQEGGPIDTPALAEDVPAAGDGNFARAEGAVAFGTPTFPTLDVHKIEHLNDGLYGNPNSWIGEFCPGTDPSVAEVRACPGAEIYAGIYFTQGVQTGIEEIAMGRDNTGQFAERSAGSWVIQITSDEFDFNDHASVTAANWITLCQSPATFLRTSYCVGSVSARAVRILTAQFNAIDEIEVLGQPEAPELTILEEGGEFDASNLAHEEGATPFAIDSIACCPDIHNIPNLNDGLYGNSESWIGQTGDPAFVGIAFPGMRTVSSVAFGRDNGGEPAVLTDRSVGVYTVQYTQAESPSAATPSCDWMTLGTVTIAANGICPPTPWLRHRIDFETVEATAMRLLVPNPGIAIDELEFYSDPIGGEDVCTVSDQLVLIETGGPPDVPTLADGNVALAADAVPFGTPPHPAPVHEIEFLNDGLYGNSNSWLGNELGATSGLVYAGILFQAGPRTVEGIALGRDNLGQFFDRSVGAYVVEYTTDVVDPSDDSTISAANWIRIGQAIDHLLDGMQSTRHRYIFPPVEVRAIRVVTLLGNAIDELEIFVGGDTEAPTIDCPDDVVVECTGNERAIVEFDDPMATDNEDPNPLVSCSHRSGNPFPLGDTVVTCTAVDMGGNTGECSFTISVVDTTPPDVTCPDDVVVDCDGPDGATVTYPPSTAVDVCSGESVTRVYSHDPGSLFPVGITEVTCTVTDENGNSETCTFNVTVNCGGSQRPGDANGDGIIDVSDPLKLLRIIFLGDTRPCSTDEANIELLDWDGSGDIGLVETVDVLNDALAQLDHLFNGAMGHPLGSDCVIIRDCPDRCE